MPSLTTAQPHIFQLVLTTDGTLPFVVMNYAEIGQDNEYDSHHVAIHDGFNGRRLHHSHRSPGVLNISIDPGNTGKAGQWVFRTDVLNISTTAVTTIGTPTGVQLYIHLH